MDRVEANIVACACAQNSDVNNIRNLRLCLRQGKREKGEDIFSEKGDGELSLFLYLYVRVIIVSNVHNKEIQTNKRRVAK